MIKLYNSETKKYHWVHGSKAMDGMPLALKATGKTRWCKSVRLALAAIAEANLKTAILCGYATLWTVEDAVRKDVIVDVSLPAGVELAVQLVKDICRDNGLDF